jgi:hypothetical protein
VLVEQAVPSDGHHQNLETSTISGRIVIVIVRGKEGFETPTVSYLTLMALEQSSKDWSNDMLSHLYYFIVRALVEIFGNGSLRNLTTHTCKVNCTVSLTVVSVCVCVKYDKEQH